MFEMEIMFIIIPSGLSGPPLVFSSEERSPASLTSAVFLLSVSSFEADFPALLSAFSALMRFALSSPHDSSFSSSATFPFFFSGVALFFPPSFS